MKTTIVLFASLMNLPLLGAWTPPANPDPHKILYEAEADAKAGRYEDGLAKHVWFHENALKLEPALRGVRLSFALMYWKQLGTSYPPALEKLKNIRDQAADRVRNAEIPANSPSDLSASYDDFNDFESINKELKESSKTKDLFVWLDSHKPAMARNVFELAEPALVEAKEYSVCGRYLEPDKSFERSRKQYRELKGMTQNPSHGDRLQEFAEKNFSNQTATLVALLVANNRKADAERIASEALKERSDPAFKAELERAQQGTVPAPWP